MAKKKTEKVELKNLIKPESKQYEEAPDLNKALVDEYIELENKQLQMMAQVKQMWDRQKELKIEMLKQLPGEDHDKFNLNIDGILVKKSFQDKTSIDNQKAIEFARGRRMLSKVAKKEWVLDKKTFEAEVIKLLSEGKISKEDAKSVVTTNYIPTLVLDDTRPPIVMENGVVNIAQ